jgi:transposase
MNLKHSNRRVHSPEFKARILGECQQPGASVAAVAIAHSLNPNVVRKWLAGQDLKRMGAARPATATREPSLQFVPVEVAKPEHHLANIATSQPDIRIELERGGLRLTLRCSASAAPT